MGFIKIINHNILNWAINKYNLMATYRKIDPHIILLNSHGVKENEVMKMVGYTTYKKNSTNELNDGAAILIKEYIKHKIEDEFIIDVLQETIETDIVEVGLATTYIHIYHQEDPIFHFLISINLHQIVNQCILWLI